MFLLVSGLRWRGGPPHLQGRCRGFESLRATRGPAADRRLQDEAVQGADDEGHAHGEGHERNDGHEHETPHESAHLIGGRRLARLPRAKTLPIHERIRPPVLRLLPAGPAGWLAHARGRYCSRRALGRWGRPEGSLQFQGISFDTPGWARHWERDVSQSGHDCRSGTRASGTTGRVGLGGRSKATTSGPLPGLHSRPSHVRHRVRRHQLGERRLRGGVDRRGAVSATDSGDSAADPGPDRGGDEYCDAIVTVVRMPVAQVRRDPAAYRDGIAAVAAVSPAQHLGAWEALLAFVDDDTSERLNVAADALDDVGSEVLGRCSVNLVLEDWDVLRSYPSAVP